MEERDEESGRFVCDFVERLPTTDTGKPFRLYECCLLYTSPSPRD